MRKMLQAILFQGKRVTYNSDSCITCFFPRRNFRTQSMMQRRGVGMNFCMAAYLEEYHLDKGYMTDKALLEEK